LTHLKSNLCSELQDKDSFVVRVYNRLLHRIPSETEIAAQTSGLKDYNGGGRGISWLDEIDSVYESAEYKTVNCQTGYFSFGASVNEDALLLHDLFDGKARMQFQNESDLITFDMPSAINIWDQKISIFKSPSSDISGYIAFTRSFIQSPNTFSVTLLSSDDGLHFTEIGLLWVPEAGHTFYDPHVSIDSSVCPPRYVMAMECLGNYYAASLCVSSTTTPSVRESWFYPEVLVDGLISPAMESASTGVLLPDGVEKYAAWTQVYGNVDFILILAHHFWCYFVYVVIYK
jgi:hypothetical protein